MTSDELTRMRELANGLLNGTVWEGWFTPKELMNHGVDAESAVFIGKFSPETVIALLDRVAELEADFYAERDRHEREPDPDFGTRD